MQGRPIGGDRAVPNKRGEKRQTRQYAGNSPKRGYKIHGFYIGAVDEHDGGGSLSLPIRTPTSRRGQISVVRKRRAALIILVSLFVYAFCPYPIGWQDAHSRAN